MYQFDQGVVQFFGYARPVLRPMLHNKLFEYLILLRGPLRLVATQFLDEQPSFVAFAGVFGWHDFGDLFPVSIIKIFNELRVLDHKRKEPILEQMRLIVLPLGQRAQALRRILLLLQQLVEYFHCLLVRDDTFPVELVLSVFEADHIFKIIDSTG